MTYAFPVVLALAVLLLIYGLVLMSHNRNDRIVFAAGCVSVIGVLIAWFSSLTRRDTAVRVEQLSNLMNDRLAQFTTAINKISEQQLISERAKAIAFREHDRETLRHAIAEETARKDWDAALALAGEIEEVFGYKQEADRLRDEINSQRESEVRKQVDQTVANIDHFCRNEQWSYAMREAERLIKLFPHDEQTMNVPKQIESRRLAHKQQLRESWEDAVNRHDIDGSIEILRRLDQYLTPAEAQEMQEKVRQVFKDKLLLLGQQFTLAMKERDWHGAVRLGETIMDGFPNSRMAQEVRENIDLLRQRVAEADNAAEAETANA
jgi:hypothetical protein